MHSYLQWLFRQKLTYATAQKQCLKVLIPCTYSVYSPRLSPIMSGTVWTGRQHVGLSFIPIRTPRSISPNNFFLSTRHVLDSQSSTRRSTYGCPQLSSFKQCNFGKVSLLPHCYCSTIGNWTVWWSGANHPESYWEVPFSLVQRPPLFAGNGCTIILIFVSLRHHCADGDDGKKDLPFQTGFK